MRTFRPTPRLIQVRKWCTRIAVTASLLALAACAGSSGKRRGPPVHLLQDDDGPPPAATVDRSEPLASAPIADGSPSLAKLVLDAQAASDPTRLIAAPDGRTASSCSATARRDGPLHGVWGSGDRAWMVGELYRADEGPDVHTQVLHTDDGGKTWRMQAAATACGLRAIWGRGNALIAVGQNGTVVTSRDRGQTWTPRRSGTADELTAVWGSGDDERFALAAGVAASAQGTALLRSHDGGESWTRYRFPYAARIASLWGTADGIYAVGDSGTILRSSDGGDHWLRQDSGTTAALAAVWGASADDVYIASHDGSILRSRDRGESWHSAYKGATALNAIGGHRRSVFAVGEDGTIVQSRDRGASWKVTRRGTTDELVALWADETRGIYVVGRDHKPTPMIGNMGSIAHAGVHRHDRHGGIVMRSQAGARWALRWGSFRRKTTQQ